MNEDSLPPPYYDSREEYKMANEKQRGRKRKYLTVECFERFVSNDFWHLEQRVKTISRLVWIILGAMITLTVIDRFMGVAAFVQGLIEKP